MQMKNLDVVVLDIVIDILRMGSKIYLSKDSEVSRCNENEFDSFLCFV
jgi:hypothetical protein